MRQFGYSLAESFDPCSANGGNNVLRQMHLARYLWAANILKHEKSKIILDAACGRGYGTNMLSQVGRVIGVDIFEEAASYAHNKYGNANTDFLIADMESDDFLKLASIDAVVSFETLEHLQNPEKALANFHQALKHDGVLLLSTPNGLTERKNAEGQPHTCYHIQSYSPARLQSLVSEAGFRDIKIYGQGPIYGLLMKYIRKGLNIFGNKNGIPSAYNSQNAKTKIHKKIKKIRDFAVDLTGTIDAFTKPRTSVVSTADNLLLMGRK